MPSFNQREAQMGTVTDELFDLIVEPVEDESQKNKNLEKIAFLLTYSASATQLGIKSVVIDFNATRRVSICGADDICNLLSAAIFMDKIDVVRLLIQSGIDLNSPVANRTPLSLAASQKNVGLVTYLIQVGAQIDRMDGHPFLNPLVAATDAASYDIMKILLLNNARMDYKFESRKTLRDRISASDHEKEFNLLKAAESFQTAIDLLKTNEFAAMEALYQALKHDADFVLSYMVQIAATANLRGQGLPHNEACYHPDLLRLFVKDTKVRIKTFEGFIEKNFSKERVKELLIELNDYEPNDQVFNKSEMIFKTLEEKDKTLKWLEKGTEFEQIKAKMKKRDYSLTNKLEVANSPVFSTNPSTSGDDKQLKEPPVGEKTNTL
jgi:Ankyrin repeats (3 copies)